MCNEPGWYNSVCIELDVDGLPINTILQSHHISDIEGTSNVTAFDAANINSVDALIAGNSGAAVYDETARCAEAFKILRSLVSQWMRDVLAKNNYADHQATHFYR